MDAVKDERGQALVVAALLLGIAALVISGLRLSQDAILARARASRAGEAAIEAATAVFADAYVAELRRAALTEPQERPDVATALAAPTVREAARTAASDLSIRNGGIAVDEVSVSCDAGAVDVALVLAHVTYQAGFKAEECSRR